tara:strand:+ start:5604 stop:5876 length:273 start_codon:yes stop_codon:yes gene_type:complete
MQRPFAQSEIILCSQLRADHPPQRPLQRRIGVRLRQIARNGGLPGALLSSPSWEKVDDGAGVKPCDKALIPGQIAPILSTASKPPRHCPA